MAEFKRDFVSIDYFINNSFIGKPAKNGYKGLFKHSRFAMSFSLPRNIAYFNDESSVAGIEEYLSNNVVSTNLPEINVTSTPVPLRFRIGQRNLEESLTVTFFEDSIMSVRNAMWSWIDTMARRRSDYDNWEREYFDNVKAQIRIYPIMLDGNNAKRHDLLSDVVPTAVQPLDLNIGGAENEPGQTRVSFKFRYHEIISESS